MKLCRLLPSFLENWGSDRTATMARSYTAVDDSGGSLEFRKLWAEYGGNCACHLVSISCSIPVTGVQDFIQDFELGEGGNRMVAGW